MVWYGTENYNAHLPISVNNVFGREKWVADKIA